MFGMIPFDRSDNNIFDLFDNFEKQFFNNTNASLPAFWRRSMIHANKPKRMQPPSSP